MTSTSRCFAFMRPRWRERITLKPGEEWIGKLELSAVSSTDCSDHLDHPVSIAIGTG